MISARKVVSSIIVAAFKDNPELDLNLNDTRLVSNNHRHITKVAVKKRNGTDEVHLVIKYRRKRNPPEKYDYRALFRHERIVYIKVYEFFQETIANFKLKDSFLLPKCYGSYDTSSYHGLTFEDLEARGFKRYSLLIPLDMEHVKLVLEAYAKWHGLSFVAKRYHLDQFLTLTSNFPHMFLEVLQQGDQIKYTQQEFVRLQNEVLNTERKYILRNGSFSDQDIEHALTKMVSEEPDYCVITHADCWVMNYMFRYETASEKPVEVKVLDWQFSGISSPVFDLSHFIYSSTDTKATREVKVLLKFYHQSMRQFLKRFCLDINKIFPYAVLKAHWSKFSHYGLLISSQIIKDCLAMGYCLDSLDFVLSDEDELVYAERIRNNFLHYAQNKV